MDAAVDLYAWGGGDSVLLCWSPSHMERGPSCQLPQARAQGKVTHNRGGLCPQRVSPPAASESPWAVPYDSSESSKLCTWSGGITS